jgi:hypothetical protein
MTPPIFQAVNVTAVQSLLKTGNGPLRFFSFGRAPQNVTKPYAVWQVAGGSPENYISNTPDIDVVGIQIDVYASQQQGAEKAREVAAAIRDAIQPYCHITSWRGEFVDPETNNFRFSFDCDWWINRNPIESSG